MQRRSTADAVEGSQRLDVSKATVLGDLLEFEWCDRFQRTHGSGAPTHEVMTFEPRLKEIVRWPAKAEPPVEPEAARRVNGGDTLIVASGSTAHALALERRQTVNLTIVTMFSAVGCDLSSLPAKGSFVAWGRVLPHVCACVDSIVDCDHDDVRANVEFICAGTVSAGAGVPKAPRDGACVRRRVMRAADRSVVIACRAACDWLGSARVASLSEFHYCVTGSGVDP